MRREHTSPTFTSSDMVIDTAPAITCARSHMQQDAACAIGHGTNERREITAAHPDDWRAWWLATTALEDVPGDPAELDHVRRSLVDLVASRQDHDRDPGERRYHSSSIARCP